MPDPLAPLTQSCPRCHEPPMMVLGAGSQAFCGNEACEVFTWNPRESVVEFEANARPVQVEVVDLPPL